MIQIEAFSDSRSRAARLLLSVACIAAITAICFPANRLVIPAMLYLVVIVLQSLWGNFISAAGVSIMAAACLDYFFVPPLFRWRIDDTQDGIALGTYLATSLVITRLATRARNEARTAERKRRETALLYQASSRLLSLAPELAAGPKAAQIIAEVFGLEAVCFFDLPSAKALMHGNSAHNLDRRTRDAAIHDGDYRDNEGTVHARCLRVAGRVTGAVGFEGRFDDEAMLLPITALVAAAFERTQSFRSAARAAAGAQVEILRSAILDAFAHEFKTPLAIILAAADGLREGNGALGEQMEMTEIIEHQTLRLTELTTRLLRLSRLDRDNVAPAMEPVRIDRFLKRLVAQHEAQSGRQFRYSRYGDEATVMADPELTGIAIGQLLDNASKYSPASSVIGVDLEVEGERAKITVTNEGGSIRPEDRERIFDRFFRGPDAHDTTTGSGLGLYVARKIVAAHGGTLHLKPGYPRDGMTAFQISFSVIRNDRRQTEQVRESVGGGR